MSDSGTDSDLSLSLVIYSSVKPIYKIYFIILIGFYLAKRNILSVTTCRDISDTIVTAIMPCLIFNNIVSNLKSSDIKNVGIICFTATLLFMFGGLFAYLTHIVTRSPKRWLGGLISVGIFPNISDLPIAYLQTFAKGGTIFTTEEGNKGVAYVCIFLMAMILYQFSLGLFRLIEWDFRDEINGEKAEDEEKKLSTTSSDDKEEKNKKEEEKEKDLQHSLPDYSTNHGGVEDIESISSEHSSNSSNSIRSQNLKVKQLESRGTNNQESTNDNIRRRGSIASNRYSLELTPSRSERLRKQRSQDVQDVINEYSEFEAMKQQSKELSKTKSEVNNIEPPEPIEQEKEQVKTSKLKTHLKRLWSNVTTASSLSLIISMAIAMSPPLKALFVQSTFYIPNAPDEQPPLSFIIDLTSYVGAASVPLGLLLLGATLARLQVKKMPKGFWKTALMMTAGRLILIPIFGVGVTTGFYKGGWYGDDKLVRLVSVLEFGLPNATSLVYFTAFYSDPLSEEHLQMDCLAVCLISQYAILWFSLPFLVTFTMKVSLGM
ncbi:unnamed protein product [Candida verbasci]|uniref:Auxin efflux carrier n=1 Tax=Candida verbasci TaxID=1227364 RepID=A0A9W4XK20_9ASCO|nr:unnamed protein product [Candida verbasci]